jgi:hypothetical protein
MENITVTNLPEPIADELWLNLYQAISIVALTERVATNDELGGEVASHIAGALESAGKLLKNSISIVEASRR